VFFLAEDLKDNHASSQGERRKTRKIASSQGEKPHMHF